MRDKIPPYDGEIPHFQAKASPAGPCAGHIHLLEVSLDQGMA